MSYKERIKSRARKTGNAWKSVLNVFFEGWKKGDFTSYGDMIISAEKEDPRFALLILLGKLNQQVENGGFSRYFGNDYASSTGRNNSTDDFDLFDLTIELAQDYLGSDFPELIQLLEKVYENLGCIYEDCPECNGGYYDGEDDYGDFYCHTCNSTGKVAIDEVGLDEVIARRLSKEYYGLKVEKRVTPLVERMFKEI